MNVSVSTGILISEIDSNIIIINLGVMIWLVSYERKLDLVLEPFRFKSLMVYDLTFDD